jgi:hypothetical protein
MTLSSVLIAIDGYFLPALVNASSTIFNALSARWS